VVQRATLLILEPIFDADFLDCSHGFRPGRSAHQALQALWQQTMDQKGGWILEVDIRKFFDNLDHSHLREFLQYRVRDGVLLRLIGKWLKAGVMEDGSVSYPEAGSPQGGVVSPLLSNVFLHYVLDQWFEQEVRPRLRGPAFLLRYADDFIIGFENPEDARRVMEVLPKRFSKYGLTVHPDKTRLVPFQSPSSRTRDGKEGPTPRPGTFDFLGFTHYWGRSRKGYWVVKRKTASSRFSRAVQSIALWCQRNRHQPVGLQQQKLNQKIRGHCAYYGITGNGRALGCFRYQVERYWRKWLNRRHRERTMTWDVFSRLLQRFPLAPVRTVHSVYARVVNP
jgi:group II intron reverse transcriptase/maturase